MLDDPLPLLDFQMVLAVYDVANFGDGKVRVISPQAQEIMSATLSLSVGPFSEAVTADRFLPMPSGEASWTVLVVPFKLPVIVPTPSSDNRRNKAMGGALQAQAKLVATNVTSVVLMDTGHWLMEQRPAETKAELKKFFSN